MRSTRFAAALVGALTFVTPTLVAVAPPAAADGPGSGTPWVVTVGDSYIAGEAGRWAGSSNASYTRADALGATAYFDNAAGTGETIARCHRAKTEAFIGGGVNGMNLACSGAQTDTFTNRDGYFKPGIDFYDAGTNKGQALLLQQFATTSNVKMVVLQVGGNDFGFADIVQRCVTNWLTSPTWLKNYCSDDSAVTSQFTAANVAAVRARITGSYQNVRTAMRNAGYADGAWTLLVKTYPSPIPGGAGFRYAESGYSRQSTGGCGFWNKDADWANATVLATINDAVRGAVADSGLTNVKVLEMSGAFNGRRLCETGVGLYEEVGLADWRTAGAVDRTEWVNQIRTVSTVVGPYFVQESIHPNYWGQLATRSCIRQAWNNGAPRSGTCAIAGTGLVNGEPSMRLS